MFRDGKEVYSSERRQQHVSQRNKSHKLHLILTPEQLAFLDKDGEQADTIWIDDERDDPLVGGTAVPQLVEVTCSIENINYIYDNMSSQSYRRRND